MVNTKRFLLLDNGGATADRYTLYDTQPLMGSRTRISYVGFDENPYHPQGFGQHGETSVDEFNRLKRELRVRKVSNVGKVIKFKHLPKEAQEFAKAFMDAQLAEE
jgi:hypothetical protein